VTPNTSNFVHPMLFFVRFINDIHKYTAKTLNNYGEYGGGGGISGIGRIPEATGLVDLTGS
jgi:hypothetical protein